MGVSYYPVFDPPMADLRPEEGVGGKPIARAMPLLTAWAAELGVRDLESFYSESNEESFALIGESVPEGLKETPIEWSDPGDGLRTVRAYLGHLRTIGGTAGPTLHFKDFKDRDESVKLDSLREDLQSLESVLVKAADRGSRFRLRIDM
jgi:hypothetical protein